MNITELPRLGRKLLAARDQHDVAHDLPEKAVQFGTGAFLRGFVDYFIDAANRAGHFNGRIVAVGSTGSGRDRKLNEQNGLYTLATRGIEDAAVQAEYQVITALSRALSAAHGWNEVLACARSLDIELVFSNTTEIGIRLDQADRLGPGAPRTYPGKLTAFLLERARHFDYASDRGVVIIPCELIENNGDRLKEIVLALAVQWSLGEEFVQWIEDAVPFCNTLVDRIVPGEPSQAPMEAAWQELGYRDDLLTVCEPYAHFAIEADDDIARRLTFIDGDPRIIARNDIAPYRTRKVRLLNATHTMLAPVALLAGCSTVLDALHDEQIAAFTQRVLFGELVPSTHTEGAEAFARQVIERFRNPYVQHDLLDITLQQTVKLQVRIVPAVVDYFRRYEQPPDAIAFGFAAYLEYLHRANGRERPDEYASQVRRHLRNARADAHEVALAVCSDATVWGGALQALPTFMERVGNHLAHIRQDGVRAALEQQMAATPA